MLVATRPFDDQGHAGNFAVWWRLPVADDDYCITTEDLAGWGDNVVTRIFARCYRRRFRPEGYVEPYEFRCIRGWSETVQSR